MSLIKEIFTRISTRSDLILIDTNTYIHNFLQNSDNDNLENVNKLKKELKNLNDFTEQLTSDLPNKLLEKVNICNDSVKKLEESIKRNVLSNIALISKKLQNAKTNKEINDCKVSYDRLKKDSSNVIKQYSTTFNYDLIDLDKLFQKKQPQNLLNSQSNNIPNFLGPPKNRRT
jgi:flavodoxin